MSIYTEETFKLIWSFLDPVNMNNYDIVHNTIEDTYKIYNCTDIEEVSYTNYVIKGEHQKLTGKIPLFNYGPSYFVVAKDNVLHCETGIAAFVPYGLDNFKPNQEVEHYIIYGKIMSQYSWLTWVRNTSSWPKVMANILGSKE